ncbi:MAG: cystathionine gamma-synthase family protein [Chloroflexi bacterium]|nr:cystathionine gamma-synthase family protein [Chloroflexota bacterium]
MTNTTSMATKAVWAGEQDLLLTGATTVPISLGVAHGYADVDTWREVALGEKPGYIYARNTNPTVAAFEQKIGALENAESVTSFATGMAAISNMFFALLKPGQRVVSAKDTYGGTNLLFLHFLPRWGIEVALCDTTDVAEIEREVAKGCDLLYLETPTNPTLKVQPIAQLAAVAHRHGAVVAVDNTFATPINQNPLALGADLVIHSATKFLGGHADAMGGVLCGKRDLVQQVFHFREINGATLDPMSAYLLLRGMKTLHLRIRQQNENAMHIARWLEKQPQVAVVNYPGLESHPQHDIAAEQMRGFGGMLSFALKGGFEAVKQVLPRLQLMHRAANLGAVETVGGPPATTSHVECSAEERAAMGIPEGLIRYSAGIEDVDDLIADLDQALRGA